MPNVARTMNVTSKQKMTLSIKAINHIKYKELILNLRVFLSPIKNDNVKSI
jgi:hypothetical protein